MIVTCQKSLILHPIGSIEVWPKVDIVLVRLRPLKLSGITVFGGDQRKPIMRLKMESGSRYERCQTHELAMSEITVKDVIWHTRGSDSPSITDMSYHIGPGTVTSKMLVETASIPDSFTHILKLGGQGKHFRKLKLSIALLHNRLVGQLGAVRFWTWHLPTTP